MRTGAGANRPGFYLPVYAPFPGWFAGIRGATHTSHGNRPESPLNARKKATENPPRSYRKPPEKCKCILRRFLGDLGRVYYSDVYLTHSQPGKRFLTPCKPVKRYLQPRNSYQRKPKTGATPKTSPGATSRRATRKPSRNQPRPEPGTSPGGEPGRGD